MTITPPTENSIPACRPRPGARGPRHVARCAGRGRRAQPASAATLPRDFVGVTAWEPMSSSLTWFSYRDTSPAPGGSFYWGFRTGLHRESGMPKPAWTAFSRFARSAR